MISSQEFKSATCGSIKDTRMAAQESALRFICFYNIYTSTSGLDGYDGNMSRTLDSCVEKLNDIPVEDLDKYVTLFKNSMKQAYSLFSGYAFRKVTPDYNNSKKSSINKSLMLAVSVLLAAHSEYCELTTRRELIGELAELLEYDKQLSDAISWSTTTKKNILYVFDCLKNELFDKFLLRNNE